MNFKITILNEILKYLSLKQLKELKKKLKIILLLSSFIMLKIHKSFYFTLKKYNFDATFN
jgi:hypothetical protein